MKISSLPKLFPLCLGLTFSALPPATADAQRPVEVSDEEEIEVVVSATRTERKAQDAPGSVSVLKRAELDRQVVEQLTDIVRYEPDVSVPFSQGGAGPASRTRPGAQSFNIRGIDGNRVLFQIDGIRQPDLFNFGGTFAVGRDYLDVNAYKRIEILKGSASGLYGSDAIGGVVTFVTLDPSDLLDVVSGRPFALKLRPSYDGADESFSETIAGAVRLGKLEVLALYTRRDGQEVEAEDSRIVNPADYEGNNFLGKFVYRWSPEHVTKLSGEFFDRQTETNLVSARRVFTFGPTTTLVNNVPIADNLQRYRLSLEHSYRAAPESAPPDPKDAKSPPPPATDDNQWLAQADARLYYQDAFTHESSVEERVSRSSGRPDFELRQFRSASYEQDILGGDFQLESRFTLGPAKNRLTYGLDASTSDVRRERDGLQVNRTTGATTNFLSPDTFPLKDLPDTTIVRFGGFVQDEISFGRNALFTLIPGVRFDYFEADADPDALYLGASGGLQPIDFTEFSITPKIAALLRLTPPLTLGAQYNRGFRNPTPEDLNGTVTNFLFGYQTIPNPDLQSETSDSFEVNLKGDYPFLKFSLAGYYNYYRDFILTFADAGIDPESGLLTFQSQNLDAAEIYGVEAKVELPLGVYTPALDGFSVRGSIGYSVGTDLENDEGLNSVNPLKLISSLRYDAPNGLWGAEFLGTFVDRKDRVSFLANPNQFVPGSYYSLDVIAYANVTKYVTANVGVYNLTGQRFFIYQDVVGLPTTRTDLERFAQPGLHVKAGLTIRF